MGGAPGRSLRAVVVAVSAMLVLGAGLGGVVWWLGHDSASRIAAGQYAARAGNALSEGQLPADLDTSDREALAREHAAILDGMGGLRPTVKVSSVTLAQGERAGVVTFDYTWKPLPDKAAWSYATTMRILALTGGDRVCWRGTWNPALIAPGLEPGQRLRATRLDSVRADIVSADGDALVTARPVTRVGIDKTREDDPLRLRASARALAQRVGINEDDYLAAVAAAGPQAFVAAIVYPGSATEPVTPAGAAAGYPGLRLVPGELPLAPYARFARPILGTVGLATAELIEKSDGRIRAGDVVGLSGLQQAHDADLAGRDGFRIEVVANGDTDRELYAVPAVNGRPLAITLTRRHQEAAELALNAVETRGASAIVAIKPSTMHVLAAASGSGSKGYSTATLGQYPPGSTFKMVTALRLLRAGSTPDSPLPCAASVTVDGREFSNYRDYPASATGRITLRRAIANSCNTALISAASTLPEATLEQAAAALGLSAPPAAGVPAALGGVPAPETTGAGAAPAARAGPGGGAAPGRGPAPESRVAPAATAIGQGQVVATPLGMATVAATIGRGRVVTPFIVVDQGRASNPRPAQPLSSAEGSALRSLMRSVVTDGSARFLDGLPGKPVLAKTGTAEYGSGNPPPTHAWMIALQGDLAVAVFVEKGESGARTAGPVLEDFLRRVAS